MGAKTAMFLTFVGILGMAGALAMIMVNSPLLGHVTDMDAVFTWSFVFVAAVFFFGTGLSRIYIYS